MKKISPSGAIRLLVSIAALLVCAFAAQAQVINFDVPGGVSGFTNFSGQGAFPDPGNNYWNAIVQNGTTSSCRLSDGATSSPITLTVSSDTVYSTGGQGTQGTPSGLQSPFYDSKPGPKTCTLNNVPAGSYYLYLYGINGDAADCNRGTTFTVGSNSLSTVNTTAAYNSFVQGNDYVVFQVTVGSGGGSISFTYQANTSVLVGGVANNIGNFNGLQLVAVDVVGAAVPFTTYEAESGTLGGGATVIALALPNTLRNSSPALEASGRAYVQLTATNQSVSWTNNTGQSITAINVRESVPPTSDGVGANYTLDLYVNGTFRQALTFNSSQTWLYESGGQNDGQSRTSSASAPNPHIFYDEAHAFISGAAVAPGSTLMLKKDSSNTASFYYIDCIDLETPPPALTQPANSLSITSYGAVVNDNTVDNTTAIQNCINAAVSAGKSAWVPSGKFYLKNGLSLDNATIGGAGPWYSTLYYQGPHGLGTSPSSTSCTVQNLNIDSNGSSKGNGTTSTAFSPEGSGWMMNNVWVSHMLGSWAKGNNGVIQNCRINNSWGDGINISNTHIVVNGQNVGGYSNNCTAQNNFIRGSTDDGTAINCQSATGTYPDQQMTNTSILNETIVSPEWANCVGLYGGTNSIVQNNLCTDGAKDKGITWGVEGGFLISGICRGNTVLRCGSFIYGTAFGAISLGDGAPPVPTDSFIADNTINNSMYMAIHYGTGTNTVIQNNHIDSPGTDGIDIGSGAGGNIILNGNTITHLSSGHVTINNHSSPSIPINIPLYAASYNTASAGLALGACSEGGQNLKNLTNGSYIVFNNVNLNGSTGCVARVASGGNGGTIQLRLDSTTGTLIGTCTVSPTGDWEEWTNSDCTLSGASGYHNLYLVFTGGSGQTLFNLEWIALTGTANGIEADAFNTESSGLGLGTCSEGGQNINNLTNGSYTEYNNINMNGVIGFSARVASGGSGGTIQVRLDSTTGPLLGTCTVSSTGGWQNWVTNTCAISGASGFHNVYLVYTGGTGFTLFNVEWFKFTY